MGEVINPRIEAGPGLYVTRGYEVTSPRAGVTFLGSADGPLVQIEGVSRAKLVMNLEYAEGLMKALAKAYEVPVRQMDATRRAEISKMGYSLLE